MNIRHIITATALTLSAVAADASTWSLDSCISYAREHNLTVRSRQLDRQGAELSVTEARDRYLPSLSASASESFSFGRGLTSENTYANRNTQSFNWGVNMNLPLFQGLSAWRQEKYARASLAAVVEDVEAAKDDVTLNVMAAYLQVLYAREIYEVALETQNLSKIELKRRQDLFEAGKIAELDVTEARSQLAQDELSAVNADNDWKLALLDLTQLLRLPDPENFDVAPLRDEEAFIGAPDEVYKRALENNHTLAASRLRIDAAKRQVDVARSGYLPTLSFNLGLGSTYYKLNGEQNPSFARQMRDNYSTGLGFSLNIPIFDAFSTRNNVRRARLEETTAKLNYETSCDNIYKDIQQAYYRAVAAEKKLSSSKIARDSSHDAFLAMQEKYNYGRANATEYEQAKSAYVRAVAENVQARYELIMRGRILAFYNR